MDGCFGLLVGGLGIGSLLAAFRAVVRRGHLMPPHRTETEEAPEGAPVWVRRFTDLVTLMLGAYVMFVAAANFEDVRRVEAVLGSIRTTLGVDGRTAP